MHHYSLAILYRSRTSLSISSKLHDSLANAINIALAMFPIQHFTSTSRNCYLGHLLNGTGSA